MVEHILDSIEKETSCQINLLDAMRFTLKTWNNVSKSTIFNSLKKAGFQDISFENGDTSANSSVEEVNNIDLNI